MVFHHLQLPQVLKELHFLLLEASMLASVDVDGHLALLIEFLMNISLLFLLHPADLEAFFQVLVVLGKYLVFFFLVRGEGVDGVFQEALHRSQAELVVFRSRCGCCGQAVWLLWELAYILGHWVLGMDLAIILIVQLLGSVEIGQIPCGAMI